MDCARILRVNNKIPFLDLLEKVNFADNHASYDKMLACYQVINNELYFDQRRFNELRFGFKVDELKQKLSEDQAARILQRATRRMLKRKRMKEERRTQGFLTLSGVVRTGSLYLVYVMLANRAQNQFRMTVREKNQERILVQKQLIKEETLSKIKGFKLKLQGIEEYLLKLI